MGNPVKSAADVLEKFGRATGVAAQGSEAAGIRAKQANISEYNKATAPQPAPATAPPVSSPKDKVNPDAKYGSRAGEQRIDVSNMVKPLGSFKHGTNYVPKTGPYILHEGEKVTSKEKNMASKDVYQGAAESLGGHEPAKKPKKEIKHINVRKGHGGKGYIAEHHHTHPEHHPMEEHVLPNQDAMMDHMMQNMGQPNPGEAEADAGQGGVEPQPAGQ